MRKLKKYKQTRFMAKGSHYDKEAADYGRWRLLRACAIRKENGQGKSLN